MSVNDNYNVMAAPQELDTGDRNNVKQHIVIQAIS